MAVAGKDIDVTSQGLQSGLRVVRICVCQSVLLYVPEATVILKSKGIHFEYKVHNVHITLLHMKN